MKLNLKQEIESSKVVEKALKTVETTMGIGGVTKPGNIPDFPSDITSLSSENVGNYYGIYESEVAYIRHQLTIAEIKYNFAEHICNRFRNTLVLNILKDKRIKGMREAETWADMDKDLSKAHEELLGMDSEIELLKSRYDIYSKYAASMSREITRRKNEDDKDGNKGGSRSANRNYDERIPGKTFVPKKV